MKDKFISVFVCISILLCSCIVTVSGEKSDELKFAVASDLHYNVPREELAGEIDDSIYWYANRRASMDDESGFIIDEFLAQCAKSECEYVLISGDLADNGRTNIQEHYDVAKKLKQFENETGKDVFVINGNHDFGENSAVTMDNFKDIYKDFGYDKALTTVDNDCSYTADLGSKYRLIALDSCDPSVSTEDGMSLQKINWVKEQCNKAKTDGKYVILMMHHNLLDHMPLQRILSHNFIVRAHYTTAELFADWGIKIVLTGHEHCSDVTSYTSTLGNVIYDFATTSLSMYPLSYRTFTLSDNEISYASKTIDSIDTNALSSVVSGYSDEQISLMNNGLNDYAKNFLKAGVQYRLELSLSMEKLGIKENAVYYPIVKTAIDKLTNLLKMPLYGENSVESKAATYGITLPKTDFSSGWDLATEFVAAHYGGNENYSIDGAEIKTLLLTVSVLLRDELGFVDSDTLTTYANAILNSFGLESETDTMLDFAKTALGKPITPIEYFTVALISPFIYEFASDNDGVDDNNGTISGYGHVNLSENLSNILSNFKKFFTKIMTYFNIVIGFLGKACI